MDKTSHISITYTLFHAHLEHIITSGITFGNCYLYEISGVSVEGCFIRIPILTAHEMPSRILGPIQHSFEFDLDARRRISCQLEGKL
jgi:hypothetical protein